ncbi:MAG: hypothetical protein K2L54_01490 [Clostridiales bacterium]|nr:hypothetical protein [Clostridiales bacterium]
MHVEYTVAAISGDRNVRRRLVDMGLLGATATVRARKKSSVLADFGSDFSAVVQSSVAERIEVKRVQA